MNYALMTIHDKNKQSDVGSEPRSGIGLRFRMMQWEARRDFIEDDWELTGSILKMIGSSLGVRRRDAGKFERSIDVPDNKID
ncbi:hypothetical protein B296_00026056 [Ensete ventricosum]|uniref:Uncharacterized protein n=1 Tax=Ensete ventricosum TaxID=4639 RepID=A0A426XTB4_ENSVE|nr:hypothetical protein B296_00026056 [Ensete ventricosum]